MSKYKILTPSGFKNFYGVKKSIGKCCHLKFSDGSELKCTLNHLIETPNGFVVAAALKPRMLVLTLNNYKLHILSITLMPHDVDVYDALEVDGGHRYYTNNVVSHNCEFMGSSGTLISGSRLKTLVHNKPIYEWDGFKQYVAPVKDNQYAMLCDVSRGKGLDYSAFHVIDITVMPYVQVATYKSNAITPTDYAYIIDKIGSLYNGAHVLVEINDIGGQVSDLLFDDLDYDNLLCTESQGRKGKSLCGGGSDVDHGVRTTTIVKSKGCSILKLLIEQQQLIINDFDTINELSRFSKKGKSYEAEDGHDDLVMGLVLFAWMTTQPYFGNLTSVRTLHNLRDDDSGWDQLTPFGFIVDGADEPEFEIDKSGTMWMKTDAWCMNY